MSLCWRKVMRIASESEGGRDHVSTPLASAARRFSLRLGDILLDDFAVIKGRFLDFSLKFNVTQETYKAS